MIDTRDIMDAQVADTVGKIEILGEEQHTMFITEFFGILVEEVTLFLIPFPLFSLVTKILGCQIDKHPTQCQCGCTSKVDHICIV